MQVQVQVQEMQEMRDFVIQTILECSEMLSRDCVGLSVRPSGRQERHQRFFLHFSLMIFIA